MLRKSLKTKTLFVCIFRLKKLTMGCHMQRKENMIYFSNFSSSIEGWVRLGFGFFDFAWVKWARLGWVLGFLILLGSGWVGLRSDPVGF